MIPVQKLDISFLADKGPKIIGRLNEVGRAYEFKTDLPWYNDVPEDLTYTASLTVIKPDNTFVITNAFAYLIARDADDENSPKDLYIMIRLNEQIVAVKGLGHYIIEVKNNYDPQDCIYTQQGDIYIDDNLLTDELIESVAEVNGSKFPDDFVTIDTIGDAVLEAIDDNISEISSEVATEIIDDNNTDTSTTWSSDKIAYELSQVGGSVDYSQTEHEIGTWVDGSKLYEMTIVSNLNPGLSFQLSCPTDVEIKEIKGMARVFLSNRFYYKEICSTASGIGWNDGKLDAEPKYSRLNVFLNYPTGSQQVLAWVTIRYTKP